MSRVDIVGLSLAEIALALLFCFLAIFVPAYAKLTKQVNGQQSDAATMRQLKDKIDSDAAKIKELGDRLDAVLLENEALKHQLEGFRQNLRSIATPTCAELGKASGWLFTATIRGLDEYEIEGQAMPLAAVRQRYSAALLEASKDECRQRVRVYLGRGVSASEYDFALRRLEQYFYDVKLGLEQ